MKAKELIEQLRKYDQELPVKIYDHTSGLPANVMYVNYIDFKQETDIPIDDIEDSKIIILF